MASVIVPRMSQSESGGDLGRVVELNNKGNIAVSSIVFPFAVFVFVFAGSVIEALYTDKYLDAVPIVRIYIAGAIMLSVEISSVLVVLRQGAFVLSVSAILLVVASLVAYYGALVMGTSGVALASVLVMFIGNIVNFSHVSRRIGRPLSALQDWATLGRLLVASILAGIAALAIFNIFAVSWPALFQLAVAGIIFAMVYLGVLFAIGGGWVIRAILGKPGQRV